MSVSGAVMIVVITVLRALLLERLPKRTFLVLWQVALARLLVPFSVPFGGSVYVLVQRGTQAVTGTNRPAAGPTLPGDFTAGMAAEAAAAPHPAAVQAVPVWAVIWLAGVLLLAAFFAAAYRRSWKKFQMSFPVEQPFARQWLQAHLLRRKITIRQCAFITSPLTFGVRHPVILLPKKTDWRDEATLQYVLEHEFVHIRRFDAVTKLLLTAAVCVHWPNPFVWVLYALANRDIELACDEAVLHRFGRDARADYARALIRMEETRNGFAPPLQQLQQQCNGRKDRGYYENRKNDYRVGAAGRCARCGYHDGLCDLGTGKHRRIRPADESKSIAYRHRGRNHDVLCEPGRRQNLLQF